MLSVRSGAPIGPIDKQPDERQLFLFGAATWNAHLIHYDREHARSEGFEDLVVHGPLQGNWLVELIGEWAGPLGRIDRVRYRNVRTAYVNRRYQVAGRVSQVHPPDQRELVEVECDVWVTGEDGNTTTEGSVTVSLPAVHLGVSRE